jgi:hypothetical protein
MTGNNLVYVPPTHSQTVMHDFINKNKLFISLFILSGSQSNEKLHKNVIFDPLFLPIILYFMFARQYVGVTYNISPILQFIW